MKTLYRICLLMLLISACRTPEKSLLSAYFNTGKLPAQSFIIDPDADTTLITGGGVRIHIAKGSFDSGKPVTIEWKEALDFQSMLKAGLLTQSGNNILRSGGMFYFNTKENLTIQKPIGIDMPAEAIVSGMQLYKGDSADGRIDWQNPKPIENVEGFGDNVSGKALFNANCAQCHGVQRQGTGPSLAGITERKSREWLYAVTHNPAVMMVIDSYLRCEKCKYGVVMQAFPALSEADMDSIYDYIEDETERLGLTGNIKNNDCDSCAIYGAEYDSLLAVYNNFYADVTSEPIPQNTPDSAETSNPPKSTDIIQGKNFYNVTIQSDGWYNIDALFKDWSGAVASKLFVKPQGERNQEMEYYLAIPSLKILVGGNSIENGNKIVFYQEDGSIPLPQLRQAFIIAVGGTDGKYFFSKKDFIISADQTIVLPVNKISKQQFDAELTQISYYGLTATAVTQTAYKDSKIDTSVKENIVPATTTNRYEKPLATVEKQLQNLAAKKTKNCGCDGKLPTDATAKDTTSALRPEQTAAPKPN